MPNSRPKCFSETAYLDIHDEDINCRNRIRTKHKSHRL